MGPILSRPIHFDVGEVRKKNDSWTQVPPTREGSLSPQCVATCSGLDRQQTNAIIHNLSLALGRYIESAGSQGYIEDIVRNMTLLEGSPEISQDTKGIIRTVLRWQGRADGDLLRCIRDGEDFPDPGTARQFFLAIDDELSNGRAQLFLTGARAIQTVVGRELRGGARLFHLVRTCYWRLVGAGHQETYPVNREHRTAVPFDWYHTTHYPGCEERCFRYRPLVKEEVLNARTGSE